VDQKEVSSGADEGDIEVDKEAVLKIISDFGKALEAEKVKPQKMILFGSYSTGTQHEGSDIDLVVISEDFAGKDYAEQHSGVVGGARPRRGDIVPSIGSAPGARRGDRTIPP
jgi:hypothetical protein